MRPFSRVISIGGVCQVAWQIERHFGFRTTSPFDWLVTPLAAIDKILADDGAEFGRDVVVSGDTAVCRHYGVAYHHEFPRDDARRPIVSDQTLTACRQKLRHKYEKFCSALSDQRPTLFIRMLGHLKSGALSERDPDPVTTEDLNTLAASLERRFPRLPFAIAYVYQREFTRNRYDKAALDPRIHSFLLPYQPQDDWQGDATNWAKLFRRFSFAVTRDASAAEAESLIG
ncbi:MAG TPA: DUF1796 family putative cysteine peptidase [Stellaceae bacterium]|nr:DUF1796 family putative cysteine peptidase [Stellaceae bacterium]